MGGGGGARRASQGAPPGARAAACDALGAADRFAVFSNGVFTAAAGGGTTINGRVAAAGNVTLDGVTLTGSAPAVVTGGDFIAGRTTGQGGNLSSGVRYAGAYDVAQNFTVNGDRTHADPPFSFAGEFRSLALLSDSWAQRTETGTVTLQPWGELQLVGSSTGLNVFTIDAADAAAGQVAVPYRVAVTGRGRRGAQQVRLCAPRPYDVTGVRAAGTFRYNGARCRNIPRLPAGESVSFVITAVPARTGPLDLLARATAVGRAGAARDRTRVQVIGGACPAVVARAAC